MVLLGFLLNVRSDRVIVMIWPIEASIFTNDGMIVASVTPSPKHNTNMQKLQHGPQNPSGESENITPHSGLAATKFYMTTTPSLRLIISTNAYNIATTGVYCIFLQKPGIQIFRRHTACGDREPFVKEQREYDRQD